MAVGEMTVTDLFRIRTFAEEVYVQAAGGSLLEFPGDSIETAAPDAAIFWVGCGIVCLLFAVAVLACRRLIADARFATMHSIRRLPLGRWKSPATAVTWMILLLIVGVPLGNLVYKAGLHTVQAAAGPQRHWSLAGAISRIAASPAEHDRELAASFEIGATAAIAATAAAILLAWWARRGGWRLGVVLAITALCLMTPGPVLGVVTIWCLNRPPDSPVAFLTWLYHETWFATFLVQTIRAMPLAVLLLWPALASIPQATLDAAKSEGAGSLRRLVLVALPQRRAAGALAVVVGLAVALGELAATALVYTPGTTPISVRSFGMLHSGVDDRLAALVLLIFLAALMVGIAAVVASRRAIWGEES
jgi:ABC-type Fe3+ transport system permease subunit